MKIVCKSGLSDDVSITSDSGIDLIEDLKITSADIRIETGCLVKAILTCECDVVDINVVDNDGISKNIEYKKEID